MVWLWLGICDVASVVLPTVPVGVALAIVPEVVLLANTDVNAVVPPELAVPLTTRKALLSCVVLLVQPVGALD